MTAPPPFFPSESRTYAVRPAVPGGLILLQRDPTNAIPEATHISVPHHGQGGEVDSREQVTWFEATLGDCAGLQETWDGCWSIDDPTLAAILETRLAATADLRERRIKTSSAATIPAILSARPAGFRTEMLDWNLHWFPGMEDAPPRYALVNAYTSRDPSGVVAYGVAYVDDSSRPGRPSEWFRTQTRGGLGPTRDVCDSARREVEAIRLDEDGLARLVDAMLALPSEAVAQFYAGWEMG